MKIFLISILILITAQGSFAVECDNYLSELYSRTYKERVVITQKTTQIDKYEGYIGKQFVSSVVYGKAYMKIASKKRVKVSTICLLENDDKPIWGYVTPR